MDCKNCREAREVVSRHVHEADLDRLERINKRWFLAWLITFVLLVGCVAGFIWYESQFMDEEWTFEATTDGGGNAIANGNGEVYYYGESESNPQA